MGDNEQPSADSPPRSDRERRHQGREVLSLVQDNTRLAAEILDQQSLNQRLSQQLTELQASQQAADQRGTVLEKERAILQHQLDHLQQETEQRATLQRQQLQAANAELETVRREAVHQTNMATGNQSTLDSLMTRALAGDNFPTFHGDPNIDPLFEDFLADYDIACEAYGIDTNAKKGKFLSSRLKGYALEVYKSELQDHDGIKDDYAAITDLLAQRFSRLFANRRTGTTNFFSRNQQEGESIVSYFHELTKLAKHAYPGERMPDSQFLERLLRGMLPWLKHKVVAKEVRTSQEALEAAVTVEANKAYLDEEKRIAVASVRPVPNENKELEKKVDKLSSAINQISSRLGENPYSRQQRMAPPNPFWQRRRWPNPQHHFPGDTQQPRFTPRRFNNNKRGNYNSRGQQKCWSCGQHGHWMSTCPQGNQRRDHRDREHRPPHRTGVGAVAATSQPAPDDISPQLTCNATSSGGGGRVSSALYLYTVAIICLCLTPLSSAQRPTICDTISPGQLLALPSVGKCSQPNASSTDHPVDVTYDIYKYNHIKYDVAGWIC